MATKSSGRRRWDSVPPLRWFVGAEAGRRNGLEDQLNSRGRGESEAVSVVGKLWPDAMKREVSHAFVNRLGIKPNCSSMTSGIADLRESNVPCLPAPEPAAGGVLHRLQMDPSNVQSDNPVTVRTGEKKCQGHCNKFDMRTIIEKMLYGT